MFVILNKIMEVMDIEELYQIIKRWIELSTNQLKFPPYIFSSNEDFITIKFRGLSTNLILECHIEGDSNIRFMSPFEDDKSFDIIADFDILIMNNNGIYYCGYCGSPLTYPTKYDLWYKHTFNDVTHWINKLEGKYVQLIFISQDNTLFMASIADSSSSSSFVNKYPDEYWVEYLPVDYKGSFISFLQRTEF